MTAMVIAVAAFALINFGLKALGVLLSPAGKVPRPVQMVLDALPLALLCGMLVTSVVGVRGANLDLPLLAGLAAAAAAWALRAQHLVCVVTCVLVTSLGRLLV